jgi:hypothetical protein
VPNAVSYAVPNAVPNLLVARAGWWKIGSSRDSGAAPFSGQVGQGCAPKREGGRVRQGRRRPWFDYDKTRLTSSPW